MKQSVSQQQKDTLLGELKTANLAFQAKYPGDRPDRQPVHTLYGGANLFKSDTCIKLGEVALGNLKAYAPDFVTLAKVLQLPGYEHLPQLQKDIERLSDKLGKMEVSERKHEPAWLAYSIYNKIVKKLQTEAVEDFRIDFEDGFGNRPDAEEDATAIEAATQLAMGMQQQYDVAVHRHQN